MLVHLAQNARISHCVLCFWLQFLFLLVILLPCSKTTCTLYAVSLRTLHQLMNEHQSRPVNLEVCFSVFLKFLNSLCHHFVKRQNTTPLTVLPERTHIVSVLDEFSSFNTLVTVFLSVDGELHRLNLVNSSIQVVLTRLDVLVITIFFRNICILVEFSLFPVLAELNLGKRQLLIRSFIISSHWCNSSSLCLFL